MYQAQIHVVFAIQITICTKDHALNPAPVILHPIDSKRYAYQEHKATALARELRAHIGYLQKPSQIKIPRVIFIFYQPTFKM